MDIFTAEHAEYVIAAYGTAALIWLWAIFSTRRLLKKYCGEAA